jgi:hypothetical protein
VCVLHFLCSCFCFFHSSAAARRSEKHKFKINLPSPRCQMDRAQCTCLCTCARAEHYYNTYGNKVFFMLIHSRVDSSRPHKGSSLFSHRTELLLSFAPEYIMCKNNKSEATRAPIVAFHARRALSSPLSVTLLQLDHLSFRSRFLSYTVQSISSVM